MKVKELSEILSKLDQDKEIYYEDNEIGYDLTVKRVSNSEESDGYTIS